MEKNIYYAVIVEVPVYGEYDGIVGHEKIEIYNFEIESDAKAFLEKWSLKIKTDIAEIYNEDESNLEVLIEKRILEIVKAGEFDINKYCWE